MARLEHSYDQQILIVGQIVDITYWLVNQILIFTNKNFLGEHRTILRIPENLQNEYSDIIDRAIKSNVLKKQLY